MQALERFWEHLATYSLDDLVMYSAQAYQSMVATYNAQYWPWSQAVALAAIVAMLALVCRVSRQSTSVMLALLAAGCAWVGWAFFQQHYATLHWAANRFAGLFYAMALVLIAAAASSLRQPLERLDAVTTKAGRSLMLWVCLAWPVLGWFKYGDVLRMQWVGLMPDATACAVLLAALLCRKWLGIPLFLLASAWLAYSAALAWVMGG